MAYEIDFIGVGREKASKDADAICLRWKNKNDNANGRLYTVGVVDAGFEVHGEAMVQHMNRYYFNDVFENKDASEKVIDFVVITHPDQDHTAGITKVLENFHIKAIYMNRPWLYLDELFPYVNDGRITLDSLERRLREKYKMISEIEAFAKNGGIPILEAFQGNLIEGNMLVLSPHRQFYLDLIVESEKTPLCESAEGSRTFEDYSNIVKRTKCTDLSVLESWTDELLREEVKTSAENETSVILRGAVEGFGFMLTGDAGVRALTKAMDYMDVIGEDTKSNISFFQIPHHGGRHNISPSVLNRMIGKPVEKGVSKSISCIASVAESSDHPLKMVTNAYIRRGAKAYKTDGRVLHHQQGDMPQRGWTSVNKIDFARFVEDWGD